MGAAAIWHPQSYSHPASSSSSRQHTGITELLPAVQEVDLRILLDASRHWPTDLGGIQAECPLHPWLRSSLIHST